MLKKLEINSQNLNEYAEFLFDILADNMTKIAPTQNSRDEDFKIWFTNLQQRLLENKSCVIAFLYHENIVGYLQYSVSKNTLIIEEVEISTKFLVKYNILGSAIKLLFEIAPENIVYIEAYANKNNKVSTQLLKKAGFEIIGTNKTKTSFLHRAVYSDLAKRFKKI